MEYKFIEHTADIEFETKGKDLEEVFSGCAYAFVESICKTKVLEKGKKNFEIRGEDLESLLYNFLEEFLTLFDSEHFVLGKILKLDISKKEKKLFCEVAGDNAKNYEIISYVKAVTYNSMFVRQEKDKWVAHVVLDV